jgi:hypothetical protein
MDFFLPSIQVLRGKGIPGHYYAPCHEDLSRSGGTAPLILDLEIKWQWSDSHPVRFTPGKRDPATHRRRGWMGITVRMQTVHYNYATYLRQLTL